MDGEIGTGETLCARRNWSSKGSTLSGPVGDVVCDEGDLAIVRVFMIFERDHPGNHSERVIIRSMIHFGKLIMLIQHEGFRLD